MSTPPASSLIGTSDTRMYRLAINDQPTVGVEAGVLAVTVAEMVYRRYDDKPWRIESLALYGHVRDEQTRREKGAAGCIFYPTRAPLLMDAPDWARALIEQWAPAATATGSPDGGVQ